VTLVSLDKEATNSLSKADKESVGAFLMDQLTSWLRTSKPEGRFKITVEEE